MILNGSGTLLIAGTASCALCLYRYPARKESSVADSFAQGAP
jgi:hypothetical protein